MTGADAVKLSGRSESWLKRHTCAWCDQTLWRTLRSGCAAMYEKCDPAKKDFGRSGNIALKTQGKPE
jgi:hypothetical protein